MRIQDQIVTKFTADAKELEQALQRIREIFAQTFTTISNRVRAATQQMLTGARQFEQTYGRAARQTAQQVTQAFQTINTRAQEAARGIQQAAQQAGRGQQQVVIHIEDVERALEAAGRTSRRAAADFSIFTPVSREAAVSLDRLNRMLGQASTSFRRSAGSVLTGVEALDVLSMRLDRASMMMWRFTMAVIPLRMLSFYLGGLTAALLGYVYKIATAAGELDQARRAFAAATGSMAEATEIIEYLREQAPKIRYTLAEIIEAARILTVAGYDVRKLLMPMADLAAGINQAGITIADAARAFVDAMHGEFRRMKNTFDITKQEVEKFAQGAIDAQGRVVDKAKLQYGLLMAIQEKYGGANEAAMAAIAGAWANFSDSLTRFFQAAGRNLVPFFVRVLNFAGQLIDVFERLASSPFGAALLAWGPLIAGLAAGMGTLIALVTMLIIHMRGLVAMYQAWRRAGTEAEMDLIRAHREMVMLEEEAAAMEVAAASRYLPVQRQRIELMKEQLALAEAIARQEAAAARIEAGVVTPEDIARAGLPSIARRQRRPVVTEEEVGRGTIEVVQRRSGAMQRRLEREVEEAQRRVAEAEERLAIMTRIAELPERTMYAQRRLPQIGQQLDQLRHRHERVTALINRQRESLDQIQERLQQANISEEERARLTARLETGQTRLTRLEETEVQITRQIRSLERERATINQELTASRQALQAAIRGEYGEEARLFALEIARGRELQRQAGFFKSFAEGFKGIFGMFAGGVRGIGGIGAAIGGFLGQLAGFAVISAIIGGITMGLKALGDAIYRATHRLELALKEYADRVEKLKDTTVDIPAALEDFLGNTEEAAERIKAVAAAEAAARPAEAMTPYGTPVRREYPTPLGIAFRQAPPALKRQLMLEAIRTAQALGEPIIGLEALLKRYKAIELIPTKELEKVELTYDTFLKLRRDYEAYADEIDNILKQLENQAAAFDNIAREQAENIAQSKELRELLQRHGASWDQIASAIRLSKYPARTLARQYEEIEDTIERNLEDLDGLDEKMKKQLDQGQDINEVMKEYRQRILEANQNYQDLVAVVRLHNEISERERDTRDELLRKEQERLRVAWQVYTAFKAQQEALEAQLAASLVAAGGGTAIATGRVTALMQLEQARAEWIAGKRRDAIKTWIDAINNLRKAEEQEFNIRKQTISNIQDPEERARRMVELTEDRMDAEIRWYQWRRRSIYATFMDERRRAQLLQAIDRDHYIQMQQLEEERQKWIRQTEIEYRNKIIGNLQIARQEAANMGATKAQLLDYDIAIAREEREIALLQGKAVEAGRKAAEIRRLELERERALLQLEQDRIEAWYGYNAAHGTTLELIRQHQLAIYEAKMREADWLDQHGRHIEALRKRTEAQKALNALISETVNFESQRYNVIKKLHELGLASETQLQAARQRAAQAALEEARRFGLNTKEGMQAFMRYLDLAYEKTERATEGIIRKILGAPQELIERIISPAELQRRFGVIEGLLMPLGKPLMANIIQVNRGELVIRVRLDGLPENLDKQLRSALESGLQAMAHELAARLSGR